MYLILEEDITNQVTTTIENTNVVRVKFINDFMSQLNKNFMKFGNKKRKYAEIKNVLMFINIFFGTSLIVAGTINEITQGDANRLITVILGCISIFFISTIPISNKLTETACNKNRNFESLVVKKLNQVKEIFSKIVDDGNVTHDEFLKVVDCNTQYEDARNALKM